MTDDMNTNGMSEGRIVVHGMNGMQVSKSHYF